MFNDEIKTIKTMILNINLACDVAMLMGNNKDSKILNDIKNDLQNCINKFEIINKIGD